MEIAKITLMKKISAKNLRKSFSLLISVFTIAVIAYFDLKTGERIAFSSLYLLPLIYLTWEWGIKTSVIFAVLCSFLRFSLDKSTIIFTDNYGIPYFNFIIKLSAFTSVSYLVYLLKKLILREKALSRLNSEMISAISHEFNNLLTGIHLSSTLLRDEEGEKLTREREKLYRILDQNYTVMMQNIKVFLNKARLESGKLKLSLEETEIRRIINHTLEMLAPLTFEKNLTMIKNFPDSILLISCDPDAISMVLSNLISNAIKYSPNGGEIILSISEVSEKEVEISVKDNGIGIARNDLGKIFSGFYRTAEGSKQAKGFGIGLKVSKELLALHGSNLEVDSEKGKGSRFYFKLPKH